MPKQYSYQNHPVVYKVYIGNFDEMFEDNPSNNQYNVTSDVQSIEGIETSLDYPNINEFRVNEATLVLQDPDNDYNPQKADNYYKRSSHTGTEENPAITESGYRSPVAIRAGFLVNGTEELETIYAGQILNIYKDAKTKDVRIICSDESQKMRDEPVTDFGVEKKMLVESSGGSLHGNYPFFAGLTQPSEDSVSGTEGTNTLMKRRVLRTEGPLDSNNFRETAFGIETEGKPTEDDPILTFKAPWRSRTVESIIEKLLAKYNIRTHDIQLPIATAPNNFFSNLGKAEYETAFSDTDIAAPGVWQWSGTVTDMIVDDRSTTNDAIYLLISQHGSRIRGEVEPLADQPIPKIVKWDLVTDERTLVTQLPSSSSNVEAWKFVANSDFTTFYVLACDPVYAPAGQPRSSGFVTRPGFEFASYDSSEYANVNQVKTKILRVTNANTANPTVIRYIDPSVAGHIRNNLLFPQVAMHYHLGFTKTTSTSQNRYPNRQGNLPDSRRNFVLNGDDLYYPYASRATFGVAKVDTTAAISSSNPSSVISTGRDQDGFNLAGFDFWVDIDLQASPARNDIYFAFTNINTTNNTSRFRIVRSTA